MLGKLNMIVTSFGVVLLIILLGLIYYSNKTLRIKHDEDIRIVWYFYSLTLVISHLIGFWATSQAAIDHKGFFQGETGEFISKLISASIDINLSFVILGAIASLIVLPQFISYFFSGLVGVAARPIFLNESLSFLMWGTIKTFIVTSGVTTSILLFGTFLEWESFAGTKVLAWILISMGFNSFAFFTLLIFRESKEVIEDLKKRCPSGILSKAYAIHKFFTRHIKQVETPQE